VHPLLDKEASEMGLTTLNEWNNFHEKIKELPKDEKEVFECLFYQEMSQEDTARLLEVTPRTVQRRWRSAKLNLAKLLRGEFPKI
jgi:RNA polymerase sigma factor (sigma-70 family)